MKYFSTIVRFQVQNKYYIILLQPKYKCTLQNLKIWGQLSLLHVGICYKVILYTTFFYSNSHVF